MAIGKPVYAIGKNESKNIVFRRSLFAVADIKKGEKFTKDNIRSIRPGYGLATKYLKDVLGKSATKNISRGVPLSEKMILKDR